MILNNKDQIEVKNSSCSKNYCGDGTMLNGLYIDFDGLEDSLKKYAEYFL